MFEDLGDASLDAFSTSYREILISNEQFDILVDNLAQCSAVVGKFHHAAYCPVFVGALASCLTVDGMQ